MMYRILADGFSMKFPKGAYCVVASENRAEFLLEKIYNVLVAGAEK